MAIYDKDFKIDHWRFEHTDESKFIEKAETGDIILLRGNHIGGKLTRTFTKGECDHAAMVVRLENYENKIFLLESVMVRGVGFTSWEFYKENNTVYQQLFYRKLKCNRDNDFYDKFDHFISEV